mmetsp:Transcript_86484/g.244358  ORF Transcript_86484/g.244358 Transcript_86484/m.244358 type:complete len:234 (+) Transcript_86484:1088-1789(+)
MALHVSRGWDGGHFILLAVSGGCPGVISTPFGVFACLIALLLPKAISPVLIGIDDAPQHHAEVAGPGGNDILVVAAEDEVGRVRSMAHVRVERCVLNNTGRVEKLDRTGVVAGDHDGTIGRCVACVDAGRKRAGRPDAHDVEAHDQRAFRHRRLKARVSIHLAPSAAHIPAQELVCSAISEDIGAVQRPVDAQDERRVTGASTVNAVIPAHVVDGNPVLSVARGKVVAVWAIA